MQKFEFLRQPLLGELAMSPEEERRREREEKKNAIYSGQLRLCQQPREAHALCSDQKVETNKSFNKEKTSLHFLLGELYIYY